MMRTNRMVLLTLGIVVSFIGVLHVGKVHMKSEGSFLNAIIPYLEKSEQGIARKYDYFFRYNEHQGDTFIEVLTGPGMK